MDDTQFSKLDDKLDKITRLLTVIALKDEKTEQGKIELLDMVGFRTSEMGRLLNKSPQNISTVLGILRKKNKDSTIESPQKIESNEPSQATPLS